MKKSEVLFCSCQHKYQDKIYGKQKRLHNARSEENARKGNGKYRCTVCGTIKK